VRQQWALTTPGKKAAVEPLLCPQKCIWDVVAGVVAWRKKSVGIDEEGWKERTEVVVVQVELYSACREAYRLRHKAWYGGRDVS